MPESNSSGVFLWEYMSYVQKNNQIIQSSITLPTY